MGPCARPACCRPQDKLDGFVPAHFIGWYLKVRRAAPHAHPVSEPPGTLTLVPGLRRVLDPAAGTPPWAQREGPPQTSCLWLQTLMIRDWWMCSIVSVMFEFLEYSLEHQLPNFSECWWDHVGAPAAGTRSTVVGHTGCRARGPSQRQAGICGTHLPPASTPSGSWMCWSAMGWASTAA